MEPGRAPRSLQWQRLIVCRLRGTCYRNEVIKNLLNMEMYSQGRGGDLSRPRVAASSSSSTSWFGSALFYSLNQIALTFLYNFLLSFVTKKWKKILAGISSILLLVGQKAGGGAKRIKRIFDTFKCALIVTASAMPLPASLVSLFSFFIHFSFYSFCLLNYLLAASVPSSIFVIFLAFRAAFFIVCFCVLGLDCQHSSQQKSPRSPLSALVKSNLLSFCQLYPSVHMHWQKTLLSSLIS